MVVGLKDKSYARRLTSPGLKELEDDRIRGNLIFTFSIMTGCVDRAPKDVFACPSADNLQGRRIKLYQRCFSQNLKGVSCSMRIIRHME